MDLLAKAHKVLLNKNQKQVERQRLEAEDQSVDIYSQFVNYTSVKQMIDDMCAPVIAQVPVIKKDNIQINTQLTNLQGQIKQRHNEIADMSEQLRGLGELTTS